MKSRHEAQFHRDPHGTRTVDVEDSKHARGPIALQSAAGRMKFRKCKSSRFSDQESMERIDWHRRLFQSHALPLLDESRQKYPPLRVLPCAVGTCGWNLPAPRFWLRSVEFPYRATSDQMTSGTCPFCPNHSSLLRVIFRFGAARRAGGSLRGRFCLWRLTSAVGARQIDLPEWLAIPGWH